MFYEIIKMNPITFTTSPTIKDGVWVRIDVRGIGKPWSLGVGLTLEVRRSGGA
jgi:hypothetical protein